MVDSVLGPSEFAELYPELMDRDRWKVIYFYRKCSHCEAKLTHIQKDMFGQYQAYAVRANGFDVRLTVDHIIPRSKNGPSKLSNYQCLCSHCNLAKGNRSESEMRTPHPDDIPPQVLEQLSERQKVKRNYKELSDWMPYYGF